MNIRASFQLSFMTVYPSSWMLQAIWWLRKTILNLVFSEYMVLLMSIHGCRIQKTIFFMIILLLFAYVFPSAAPSSFQATSLLSLLDEREGVFFCSSNRVSICGCRERKRLNVNGVLKEGLGVGGFPRWY